MSTLAEQYSLVCASYKVVQEAYETANLPEFLGIVRRDEALPQEPGIGIWLVQETAYNDFLPIFVDMFGNIEPLTVVSFVDPQEAYSCGKREVRWNKEAHTVVGF